MGLFKLKTKGQFYKTGNLNENLKIEIKNSQSLIMNKPGTHFKLRP